MRFYYQGLYSQLSVNRVLPKAGKFKVAHAPRHFQVNRRHSHFTTEKLKPLQKVILFPFINL